VTLTRRDTLERVKAPLDEIELKVEELMNAISANLRERSERMMRELITDAESFEDIRKILNERKIARVEWCGDIDCAEEIKESIGGEIRGERYDVAEIPKGTCVVCGRQARSVVYVARAY